jgi:hypothetical protein
VRLLFGRADARCAAAGIAGMPFARHRLKFLI